MSLSVCLPNLVIVIPRIQTLSAMVISCVREYVIRANWIGVQTGSKPKPMASVPLSSVPNE